MDQVYWIWLQQLFGSGTARSQQMMEEFAHPELLYTALKENELPSDFLAGREKKGIESSLETAKQILHITHRKGCDVITPDHPDYPPLLQHIYAKPAALYVKGDLSYLRRTFPLCMVGARHNSDYGKEVATSFAESLVQYGISIVSGLALGIDSLSHAGALQGGGATIGVLACGLDIDYPRGNSSLKRAMSEHGAVVSEYPMGTMPVPTRFPPRNRVMVGMCRGVIVIEAGETSGALITAHHALDMGREVFVVPGSIFSGKHTGSHALIQQGKAKLVSTPLEVVEEFPEYQSQLQEYLQENHEQSKSLENRVSPPLRKPKAGGEKPSKKSGGRKPLPDGLDDNTKQVYQAMNDSRQTADQLATATELPIEEVLSVLTVLEVFGLVQSFPGGLFSIII